MVPTSLQKELLEEFCDDKLAGHMRRNSTFEKLRARYWWPSMHQDIRDWIATCQVCQAQAKLPRPNKAPLQPILVGRPMHRVGIDIVGPLPRTSQGNAYILVMMDYFAKWPEAMPIPNIKASTIACAFIRGLVCHHRAPQILLSD